MMMLKETKRATGAKGIGTSAVPKGNHTTPTLADLGLDKKTSMLARRVANLSPDKFKAVQSSVVTLSKMTRPHHPVWTHAPSPSHHLYPPGKKPASIEGLIEGINHSILTGFLV